MKNKNKIKEIKYDFEINLKEFKKGFDTFLGYDCDNLYTPDEAIDYIDLKIENHGRKKEYLRFKEELEKISKDPEAYIDMAMWENYGENYVVNIEDLYYEYAAKYYPESMSDDKGRELLDQYILYDRHTMWK